MAEPAKCQPTYVRMEVGINLLDLINALHAHLCREERLPSPTMLSVWKAMQLEDAAREIRRICAEDDKLRCSVLPEYTRGGLLTGPADV